MTYPNTSTRSFMLEIVSECKSTTSTGTIPEVNIISTDKEVTASSSNIDLFTKMNTADSLIGSNSKDDVGNDNQISKKLTENKNIGNSNVKSERTSKRTHRCKVRSPKRKGPEIEKNICQKKSIGVDAVDWGDDLLIEEKNEIKVQVLKQVTEVAANTEEEERVSSHSMEDMCRICHSGIAVSAELGRLISACSCRGTVGRIHVKCLERWLTESGKSRCELCGTKYVTKRVHKFGVLKSLVMWILSNNSKHLMVDFFGIMIMTPIAVVAAGLTGRTFAGLMAQDQLTPWPLASTFVLACMTLVCYYCWIVSALTRHALGWWIWYRSHYEVRLQIPEEGEHSQDSIANHLY
ncbi:E3 ubiquitin-protein ligase MARCHF2-like isoform X1 [Maniola hyperantus]|uniref:E3 ubiquitin-protein ligase MARCHF2-like isoform X1 n=1 Tax=Aphantopus hyperantus TaxID=2795564 RepID=UPI0021308FEB